MVCNPLFSPTLLPGSFSVKVANARTAEWAIARLQAEAGAYLSEDKEIKTVDKDTELIGSFPCKDNDGIRGKLILHTKSIFFSPARSRLRAKLTSESKAAEKEQQGGWKIEFDEMKEIHKTSETNQRGAEEVGLRFKTLEGEKKTVQDLGEKG